MEVSQSENFDDDDEECDFSEEINIEPLIIRRMVVINMNIQMKLMGSIDNCSTRQSS